MYPIRNPSPVNNKMDSACAARSQAFSRSHPEKAQILPEKTDSLLDFLRQISYTATGFFSLFDCVIKAYRLAQYTERHLFLQRFFS